MNKFINEQKRFFQILSRANNTILLTELDEKYLDMLLDKINQKGKDSLSPTEKENLLKMSKGEPIEFTRALRFTTSEPRPMGATGSPLVDPPYKGKLINEDKTKYPYAYIEGKAEKLAGYRFPIWIDGDMLQLDLPIEEQNIVMLLPSGEYECVSTPFSFNINPKNKEIMSNLPDIPDLPEELNNRFKEISKSISLGGGCYLLTLKSEI